jgi:hypothetical protein
MEEKKDEGEEIFGSRTPMVLLLKNIIKNHVYEFQKKIKIYLDVANYLSQKPIKNNVQISYSLGYTKRQNV